MATYGNAYFTVEYEDNSGEILEALQNAMDRGLKMVGEKATEYAADACPKDTGALAGSITYEVWEEDVYIGTNVKYGRFVELGTGVHATEGGGRGTPWVYQDGKGNWHTTRGMPAKPFLKPAAANHGTEYSEILLDSLKNA